MKVFVIAGEASGDALGASVMSGLQAEAREDVDFSGVGGPLMTASGLKSRYPMDDLSVMGLAEIIPRYPALRRRLKETVEAVLDTRPDVLLTIDNPDFCLRVARKVRVAAPEIRTVHYVAPSIWAWRPGRAERMVGTVDHVLAILPFEPPMIETAGVDCDFVGHPVVSDPVPSADEARAFRETYDIGTAPLVLVLPGSRRSEVSRIGPVFGEALARIAGDRPGTRFVVPAAPAVAPDVERMVQGWPGRPIVLAPAIDAVTHRAKRAAFAAADAALAASGTVSLELAAAGTPMVIGYDMHPISRAIISRLLTVDTVTLVNLVSDTRAVPEFLGRDCRPEPLAAALGALLDDPTDQRVALETTMERLGRGGPSPGHRAARAILSRLPDR